MTPLKPLSDILRRLAALYKVVEVCYLTDSDPGDGSGWVLVLGEKSVVYGAIEVIEAKAREIEEATKDEVPA